MITDAILGFFHGLLSWVVGLIPTGTFPLNVQPGDRISSWIEQADSLLPFAAPVRFWTHAVMVSFPALLAYRIALWIYNRVRG